MKEREVKERNVHKEKQRRVYLEGGGEKGRAKAVTQ